MLERVVSTGCRWSVPEVQRTAIQVRAGRRPPSGADERFAQPHHRPSGVKVTKDLALPEAQAKAMAGNWLFHGSTSYSRVLFLSI